MKCTHCGANIDHVQIVTAAHVAQQAKVDDEGNVTDYDAYDSEAVTMGDTVSTTCPECDADLTLEVTEESCHPIGRRRPSIVDWRTVRMRTTT